MSSVWRDLRSEKEQVTGHSAPGGGASGSQKFGSLDWSRCPLGSLRGQAGLHVQPDAFSVLCSALGHPHRSPAIINHLPGPDILLGSEEYRRKEIKLRPCP